MQLFEAIKEQQVSRNWEAKISEKKGNHWVSLTFLPLLLVQHLPVCNRFRWKSEKIVTAQNFQQSHRNGIQTVVQACQRSQDLKDKKERKLRDLKLRVRAISFPQSTCLFANCARREVENPSKKSCKWTEKLNRAISTAFNIKEIKMKIKTQGSWGALAKTWAFEFGAWRTNCATMRTLKVEKTF